MLKLLGEGGMGKVFLAEDPALQRQVALKVMKKSLARTLASRKRFLQEARTAAKIEHDHIIPIYQVGEDRGVPFLTMPVLKGTSLEDYLRSSAPLKLKQTLRVGIQIAEGLAAAHAANLIHRNIKPGNIWIEPTGGGRVKILDFGLGRTTEGDTGLTQSGAILGTPAYMAPEQARGEKVDHRADLYSLGCVLYRMTTGQLPHKGNDTISLLLALATQEPTAPNLLNSAVPQPLSDLILHLRHLQIQHTRVADLSPLKRIPLTYLYCFKTDVSNLSPLKDMPLDVLDCSFTPVSDLTPLATSKISKLYIQGTKVTDLSPLKDVPIRELHCDFDATRDTAILRSIKTLQNINGKPAKVVLE